MSAAEQEDPMKQVMDESVHTHDECQWEGLAEMLALSSADDIAFTELDAYVKEETMEEVRPEVEMEELTVGTLHWSGSPRRGRRPCRARLR
ncbi:hypothetical protein D1007_16928 [Hordeum vulgare]|nr:hypothetical protein D1007_16928 [Hordeum vulgare]